MLTTLRRKLPTTAWLVWGLAAFFFFSEYFARVSPSVMVHELALAFSVNARQLGSLSASFYLAYVVMQIPVGMLVDRFGVQLLLTLNTFLCALGCFIFASTHTLFFAEVARILIGFSAAFAFVSALKLASVWFPESRFGLLVGLTQGLGMLGAATGEAPMAIVVDHIGWRETMFLMAIIFFVLAILIGLFVHNHPKDSCKKAHKEAHVSPLWQSIKQVLSNSQSWLNALYIGLLYAPSAAFAEFWGVSFLERVYNVPKAEAASFVSLIFIGWFFGGPAAGWLSDKIKRRKPVMMASSLLGLVFLSCVLYVPGLPTLMVYVLLFLYGFTNTGVGISYALAAEINPRRIAGTSVAFTNMASVAIGALLQPVIGAILDLLVKGSLAQHGLHIFSASHFRTAMLLLPLCSFLSFIICFKIKETYCHSVNSTTNGAGDKGSFDSNLAAT